MCAKTLAKDRATDGFSATFNTVIGAILSDPLGSYARHKWVGTVVMVGEVG